MADLLDIIRKEASAPIRRILSVFVRRDPDTGESVSLPVSSQETVLSRDGSPDTIKVQYAQFHDCKHSLEVPVGGECFVCGAQSCQACHGQCLECRKPLCPSCAHFDGAMKEGANRWCKECREGAVRRNRWRRVGSCLLRPFVEIDNAEKR